MGEGIKWGPATPSLSTLLDLKQTSHTLGALHGGAHVLPTRHVALGENCIEKPARDSSQ